MKEYNDNRMVELEEQSLAMNRMFRNLKDEYREKLLEIAIEFYKETENRRNPNKK